MYEYYLNCTRFEEQNEKDKEYHNVGRVTKFNRKIVKNRYPVTHKYMTAHFPGLIYALQ